MHLLRPHRLLMRLCQLQTASNRQISVEKGSSLQKSQNKVTFSFFVFHLFIQEGICIDKQAVNTPFY
jgi:hypothetical protein